MSQNLNYNRVEDKEVWNKLRLKFGYDNAFLDSVIICESGHVVATTESGIIALGCIFCITQNVGQDSMGYPVLGNMRMLYFGDIYRIEDIDEAVKANTWLCPVCHIPMKSIYPKFGTRR